MLLRSTRQVGIESASLCALALIVGCSGPARLSTHPAGTRPQPTWESLAASVDPGELPAITELVPAALTDSWDGKSVDKSVVIRELEQAFAALDWNAPDTQWATLQGLVLSLLAI